MENDLFVGLRYTLNDINDTDFLGGVVVDQFTKNSSYFVEFSRRLNNQWTLDLEGRVFNGHANAVTNTLNEDDYIQLKLSYYF